MMFRFCLYGFLKNQCYYEPFLVLAFLERGLSFFQIGVLIAFRQIWINILEIPSGAVADLYGRRKSMMLSFVSYICSFIMFGFSNAYWQLFPAMFLFAIGEAFRTGTHKAIIFTWLRIQGRTNEKTEVYGYTRSWSQMGSAVSVILAAVCVAVTRSYRSIFFFSIIPYAIGLINFMGYPAELDGKPAGDVSARRVFSHLWETIRASLKVPPLRRLMLESMGFEGMFHAAKDYLQPVLKAAAVALPIFMWMEGKQRSAVLVGAVYFVLYLGTAWASRHSHRLAKRAGGEEHAARLLWLVIFLLYGVLAPLLYFQFYPAVVVCFLGLYLLQNLWRPILISRFDEYASETQGATVLSIENQSQSISTMIIAPLLGLIVDDLVQMRAAGSYTHGEFWPVAVAGAVLAIAALVTGHKKC